MSRYVIAGLLITFVGPILRYFTGESLILCNIYLVVWLIFIFNGEEKK